MNPYGFIAAVCFALAMAFLFGLIVAAGAHLTWLVILLAPLSLFTALYSGAAAAIGWMADQKHDEDESGK